MCIYVYTHIYGIYIVYIVFTNQITDQVHENIMKLSKFC